MNDAPPGNLLRASIGTGWIAASWLAGCLPFHDERQFDVLDPEHPVVLAPSTMP